MSSSNRLVLTACVLFLSVFCFAAPLVAPPTLVSVSLDPKGVGGGASTTGEVTLSGPAPEGGISVNLASSHNSARLQSSVKVLAGKTSATFAISTIAVSAQAVATITATLNGASQSAELTINPVTLASISVHPTSITAGADATGVLELNGPAGPGGLTVTLASADSNAKVPEKVTIAAGHSSGTFTVGTAAVSKQTSVTITAACGAASYTAALTLNPVALVSLSLSAEKVASGSAATGTVTLNGPAPEGGIVVTLSSNSGSASVPATVTVPAGASEATFSISTPSAATKAAAQITATLNSVSKSASLSIGKNPTAH